MLNKDSESAFSMVRDLPDNIITKPMFLDACEAHFSESFEKSQSRDDIDNCVLANRLMLRLIPSELTAPLKFLDYHGVTLVGRNQRKVDMNKSVTDLDHVENSAFDVHPQLPFLLNRIGAMLLRRCQKFGDLEDVIEAISLQRKGVQLTPEGHQDMPRWLADLGNSLQCRFSCAGDLTDISEAISLLRKAVQLTPEGHPCKRTYLTVLGNSLQQQFSYTGQLTDLSEAISSLEKAVQLTPMSHSHIPKTLSSLALLLSSRFDHTRNFSDIRMAISSISLAANLNSGLPSYRLDAAKHWEKFSQKYDATQLLRAHQTTVHLTSHIACLEQNIEKRHNNLIEISTVSRSAGAAAFSLGQTGLALEWLEQGRCLVWSQLNDLRTPFDTLQSYNPEIANELRSVAQALENAESRAESYISIVGASMPQKSSSQDEMATYAILAHQWDELLTKVRNIPYFEEFLRPPSSSTLLKNLPNSGTVIVINIHQDRCDALALRSGIELLHIGLPEFSYNKADSLRKDLKTHLWATRFRMRESKPDDPHKVQRAGPAQGTSLQHILATLWILVVKPILNGLGYSVGILTNSFLLTRQLTSQYSQRNPLVI
jgi:hypothetical protein